MSGLEDEEKHRAAVNAILGLYSEIQPNTISDQEMNAKERVDAIRRQKANLVMLKDEQIKISMELHSAVEHKLELLQKSMDNKLKLEAAVAESDQNAKDIKKTLCSLEEKCRALQQERDRAAAEASQLRLNLQHLKTVEERYIGLQQEQIKAVEEGEELRRKFEELTGISSRNPEALASNFSYLELKQATENFSDSLKIGEGGFGTVYKGFLRSTTVAIKILHQENLLEKTRFHQEVSFLSRMRHPNLVTLIGSCPESSALVYEFLPNRSLEECLARKDGSPSLTWQVRTRIIADIRSALIFLHSNEPFPIVHGNLKPDNILLDANFVSKLVDFGLCRFLIDSNNNDTLYRFTKPQGNLPYIDPMFLSKLELTTGSDVYSFGIIILRLLTGKAPFNINKEVKDALRKGNLASLVDASAGDWPPQQVNELAHLGLSCSQLNRKDRPELVGSIWSVIEDTSFSF